jgi:hypothetical protein
MLVLVEASLINVRTSIHSGLGKLGSARTIIHNSRELGVVSAFELLYL